MTEPLIILDWDDTILPTTFLSDNHCQPEELAAFAVGAERLLRTCLGLGKVVLCTNAELWWPQSSAWTYFPQLGDVLADIPVYSAQASFAPLGYADPFDWKRLAFEQIVASYQATNVLSVGDAWYERAACILACRSLAESLGRPVCCKSVKFLDVPTMDVLARQQAVASALLPRVLAHPGCLDIFLPAENLEKLLASEKLLAEARERASPDREVETSAESDCESSSTRPSTTRPATTPPTPTPARKRPRRRRKRKDSTAVATLEPLTVAPPDVPFACASASYSGCAGAPEGGSYPEGLPAPA